MDQRAPNLKKPERAYNIRGPWDATDVPNSFGGPSSETGPGNAWEHTGAVCAVLIPYQAHIRSLRSIRGH